MTQTHIPPHNTEAEMAVLAAVILDSSGAMLDEVRGVIGPGAFFNRRNSLIFEAVCALADKGEKIDTVTVLQKLRDEQREGMVGGASYLYKLIEETPAIVNAGEHARILREHYRVRQTVALAQRIAVDGYTSIGSDADSVQKWLEEAEASIAEIVHVHEDRALVPLSAVLDETAQMLDAIKSGGAAGVPTGFTEVDSQTTGLHDGDFNIIAARPGMGKALALDEPVLTDMGWVANGELQLGQQIHGSDGRLYEVLEIVDHQDEPMLDIVFDDGTTVRCSADHLWATRTRSQRRNKQPATVKKASEIRDSLTRADSGGRNHSVALVQPLRFPERALPVDPYVLGVWLGDGCKHRITNPERDVVNRVRERIPSGDTLTLETKSTKRCATWYLAAGSTTRELRSMGLFYATAAHKFVPRMYLTADAPQRLALLQGLCDTDGYVTDPSGAAVEFCTASATLARQVAWLTQSLGGIASVVTRDTHYLKGGVRHKALPSHRMVLSFPRGDIVPVTSRKHLRKFKKGPRRIQERFIVDVRDAGRAPARCIRTSAPDALYVTRGCVLTHNSAYALGMAERIAAAGYAVPFFSLEMPRVQLGTRMVAMDARIDLQNMRKQNFSASERAKADASIKSLRDLPLFIDDSAALTPLDIKARVKRLQREIAGGKHPSATQGRIGAVFIDYLQLLRPARQTYSREQDVASIGRDFKALAKTLGVPVIALCQLNREVEKRQDKKPILSDLRESGAIEQEADAVFFIYRPAYYDRKNDTALKGWAEIICAKQRNGPTGSVRVAFKEDCTRFDNLKPGDVGVYDTQPVRPWTDPDDDYGLEFDNEP